MSAAETQGDAKSDAELFTEQLEQEVKMPPPELKRGTAKRKLLIILAILVLAAIAFDLIFLHIDRIAVVGLQKQNWAAVLSDAGLEKGIHYFAATDDTLRPALEKNRYIKYVGIEKIFPWKMIIHVQERQLLADVQLLGITYMMDETGMVLEKNSTGALDESLVYVTGLLARDTVFIGKEIVPSKPEQLSCYQALMTELLAQNRLSMVREINVSSADSLYMVLRDGYTVMLGSTDDLRAKLGTTWAVVEKLREMNLQGGTLDATLPGEAVYQPVE